MPRFEVEIPGIDVVFNVNAETLDELDKKTKDLEARYAKKPTGEPFTPGEIVVSERQRKGLTPHGTEPGAGDRPELAETGFKQGMKDFGSSLLGSAKRAGSAFLNADPQIPEPMASARAQDRMAAPAPEPVDLEAQPQEPPTWGQRLGGMRSEMGLGARGGPAMPVVPDEEPPDGGAGIWLPRAGEEPAWAQDEEPLSTVPHAGSKFLASSAVDKAKPAPAAPSQPHLGKNYEQVQRPDGSVVPIPREMKKRTITLPDGRQVVTDVPYSEFAGKEPGEAPYKFLGQSGYSDDNVNLGENMFAEEDLSTSGLAFPSLARGAVIAGRSIARMPELKDRTMVEAGRKGAAIASRFLGQSPEEAERAQEAVPGIYHMGKHVLDPSAVLGRQAGNWAAEKLGAAQDVISQHPQLQTLDRTAPQGMARTRDLRALSADVIENTPQLIASALAARTAGPLAGAALMFPLEAGGQMSEMDAMRMDLKEIPEDRYLMAAIGTGVINGVLESLGGGAAGDQVLKWFPGINKTVAAILRTRKGMLAEGLLGEGATESAQEWVNIWASHFAEHPPKSLAEVMDVIKDPKNWDRAAQAGVVGAALGGGVSSAGVAKNELRLRAMDKRHTMAPEGAIPPYLPAPPLETPVQAPPGKAPPTAEEMEQIRSVPGLEAQIRYLNTEVVPKAPPGAVAPTQEELQARFQTPPPQVAPPEAPVAPTAAPEAPAEPVAPAPPEVPQPETPVETPQANRRTEAQKRRYIEAILQNTPEEDREDLLATFRELEEVALKDVRTGLGNAAAWAQREKEHGTGTNPYGGMVFMDLTKFHDFNHDYGMSAGDQTIQFALGKVFGPLVQEFGGEAFSPKGDEGYAVFPTLEAAQSAQKALQERLASARFSVEDSNGQTRTFSQVFGRSFAGADKRDIEAQDVGANQRRDPNERSPWGGAEIQPGEQVVGGAPGRGEGADRGQGAESATGAPDVRAGGVPGQESAEGGAGAAPEVAQPEAPAAPKPKYRMAVPTDSPESATILNDAIRRAVEKHGEIQGEDPFPQLTHGKLEGGTEQGWKATIRELEAISEEMSGKEARAAQKVLRTLKDAVKAGPQVEVEEAPAPTPEAAPAPKPKKTKVETVPLWDVVSEEGAEYPIDATTSAGKKVQVLGEPFDDPEGEDGSLVNVRFPSGIRGQVPVDDLWVKRTVEEEEEVADDSGSEAGGVGPAGERPVGARPPGPGRPDTEAAGRPGAAEAGRGGTSTPRPPEPAGTDRDVRPGDRGPESERPGVGGGRPGAGGRGPLAGGNAPVGEQRGAPTAGGTPGVSGEGREGGEPDRRGTEGRDVQPREPEPRGLGEPDRPGGKGLEDEAARKRKELLERFKKSAGKKGPGAASLRAGLPDTSEEVEDDPADLSVQLVETFEGASFTDVLDGLKDLDAPASIAAYLQSAYEIVYDKTPEAQRGSMTSPDSVYDDWTPKKIREYLTAKPVEKPAEEAPVVKKKTETVEHELEVETDEGGFEAQKPYTPRSKNGSITSLVPTYLMDATREALDRVEKKRGDIDEFVRKELGFTEKEMRDSFSGEQVDALALAFDKFRDGMAFIIGDQTGLGKGRVVAAVLAWSIRNGTPPIFFTQKANLYSDMMRDLAAIGHADVEPLVTNTKPTGGDQIRAGTSPDGKERFLVFTPNQAAILREATDSWSKIGKLEATVSKQAGKKVFDAIFTTYTQIQGPKGDERYGILATLAENNVAVFDESHEAAGGVILNATPGALPAGGKSEGMHRGNKIRKLIPRLKAALFSSATYAKRPDSLVLYGIKSEMSRLGIDTVDLARTIEAGGVPLQQVLSRMLVGAGTMVRREKSFEGITFETIKSEVPKAAAEKVSEHSREIFKIDERMEAVKDRVARLVIEKGLLKVATGEGVTGAKNIKFKGMIHNVVSQALLAMKADLVVAKAIESLTGENPSKPFIAVANTMQYLLDAEDGKAKTASEEETDEEDWNAGEITFADNMLRYLERTRKFTFRDRAGNEEKIIVPMEIIKEVAPSLAAEMEKLAKVLEGDAFMRDIPGSPLDVIRTKLENAGYGVAEVTGRGRRIEYQFPEEGSGGKIRGTIVNREHERSIEARNQAIMGYNGHKDAKRKVDVILANQSGSTGLSAQAKDDPQHGHDTRRRHMIIAQPDANIDTFQQMLGRINRVGQLSDPAHLPLYTLLVSDLPIETRPAAALMKKMASLSANTTGARENIASFDMPDFLNKVGDVVMAQYLGENPDLNLKLGEPLKKKPNGDIQPSSVSNLAARASGRVLLLKLNEQKEFYETFVELYKSELDKLRALGQDPLVASTYKLKATEVGTVDIMAGDSTLNGEFGEGVRAAVYETTVRFQQMPSAELKDLLEKALHNKNVKRLPTELPLRVHSEPETSHPMDVAQALISDFEDLVLVNQENWDKDNMERITELLSKDKQIINLEKQIDEMFEMERRAHLELIEPKIAAMRDAMRRFRIADAVTLRYGSVDTGMEVADGVITGVRLRYDPEKDKFESPWALSRLEVTLALNGIQKTITVKASQLHNPNSGVSLSLNARDAGQKGGEPHIKAAIAFMESHKKGEILKRRIIFRGNILKALDKLVNSGSAEQDARARGKWQVARFTMKKGGTEQGILMHPSFDVNGWIEAAPVYLEDPKHIVAYLKKHPGHLVMLGTQGIQSRLNMEGTYRGSIIFGTADASIKDNAEFLAIVKKAAGDPTLEFTDGGDISTTKTSAKGKKKVQTDTNYTVRLTEEQAVKVMAALGEIGSPVTAVINDFKPSALEIAGMPPRKRLVVVRPVYVTLNNFRTMQPVMEKALIEYGMRLSGVFEGHPQMPFNGVEFRAGAAVIDGKRTPAIDIRMNPADITDPITDLLKAMAPGSKWLEDWGVKTYRVPLSKVKELMERAAALIPEEALEKAKQQDVTLVRMQFDPNSTSDLRHLGKPEDEADDELVPPVATPEGPAEAAGEAPTKQGMYGWATPAGKAGKTGKGGFVGPISPGQNISSRIGTPSNRTKQWQTDNTLPDTDTKAPTTKEQILKFLSAIAGVPLREKHGKFGKSALGWYMPWQKHLDPNANTPRASRGVSGSLRLKDLYAIAVAAHEAGHALHDILLKFKTDIFPPEVRAELDKLGDEAYGSAKGAQIRRTQKGGKDYMLREGFAELFSRTLFHMDTSLFPKASEWFEKEVLGQYPATADLYNQTKELIYRYDQQGGYNRVLAHIRTKPSTVAEWMAAKKRSYADVVDAMWSGTLDTFRKAWVDDGQMLKRLELALMKRAGVQYGYDTPESVGIGESPYRLRAALEMSAQGMTEWAVTRGVVDMAGRMTNISLVDSLKPVIDNYDLKDWSVYAVARRALDLMDRVETETLPDGSVKTTPRPIETGISRADAQAVISEIEADPVKAQVYSTAVDDVTSWSNAIMWQIVEAGGMSKDTYKKIIEMNPIYIPMKRFFDEEVVNFRPGGSRSGSPGRGPGNLTQVVKKIRGSSKSVKAPLGELVRGAMNMLEFRNQVLVGNALMKFAEKVPHAAALIQPVDISTLKAQFTLEEIAHKLVEAGADLSKVSKEAMQEVYQIWQKATGYKGKQAIVRIWVDGKPKLFEVDKSIYDVIDGSVKQGGGLGVAAAFLGQYKMIRGVNKAVRIGATAINVSFATRNIIRDAMSAAIYTQFGDKGPGPEVIKDFQKWMPLPLVHHGQGAADMWAKRAAEREAERAKNPGLAFIDTWRSGRAATLFAALGGQMSTIAGQTDKDMDRYIRETFTKGGLAGKFAAYGLNPSYYLQAGIDKGIETLGVFETMPRVAEFKRAMEAGMEKGLSDQEAALEALLAAKDVTVNFTRMGMYGRLLNQLIPFFNARIQGTDKFFRMWREDPTRMPGEFRRFAIAKAAQLAMISMMFWWLNKDDDDYQRMRDYEKDRYFVIPKAITQFFGMDELMKIPKPDTLGAAFCTIPERVLDALYRDGDQETKNQLRALLVTLADSILPVPAPENPFSIRQLGLAGMGFMPPLVKVGIEIGTNYSTFQKRPIYPEWKMDKAEPQDWAEKTTTLGSKKAAKMWYELGQKLFSEGSTGLTAFQDAQLPPVYLDHIINSLTGGFMTEPMKFYDYVSSVISKKEDQRPMHGSDLPVVGWSRQRPESSEIVDKVYDEAKALGRKKGSRELSDEEEERLTRLKKAQERFKEIRERKAETLAERKENAREMNEEAVEAMGWTLRSEAAKTKARAKGNPYLR